MERLRERLVQSGSSVWEVAHLRLSANKHAENCIAKDG